MVTSHQRQARDTGRAEQAIAVVEAMKIGDILRAEKRAIVKRVGDRSRREPRVDELIMEFE